MNEPAGSEGEQAAGLWRAFLTPPRRENPRVARALSGAEFTEVETEAGRIAAWRLEGSGPAVLLIHGWADDHVLFDPLIRRLAAAGRACVCFDLPGHGMSAAPEMCLNLGAAAAVGVARHFGPVDAVVGHSFGTIIAAKAARDGLDIQRGVFLAPPKGREKRLVATAKARHASERVLARMMTMHAARFGADDLMVEMTGLAPRTPMASLMIHSRDDAATSYLAAEEAHEAWPGSELLLVDGRGHRRVVQDQDMAERVAGFVG